MKKETLIFLSTESRLVSSLEVRRKIRELRRGNKKWSF